MKKWLIASSLLFLAGCNSNMSTGETFKLNESIEKIDIASAAADTLEVTSDEQIAAIEQSIEGAKLADGTFTDIGANYELEIYYDEGATTNISLFYDVGDDSGTFIADAKRYVLQSFDAAQFEQIFEQVSNE